MILTSTIYDALLNTNLSRCISGSVFSTSFRSAVGSPTGHGGEGTRPAWLAGEVASSGDGNTESTR